MTIQLEFETRLALCAAVEGGRIAMMANAPQDVRVKESHRDVVTVIDLEIERSATAILSESGYPILGEETTQANWNSADNGKRHWVVDPIDGTTNLVHGMEYFGVSIGLCQELQFLVGAVCLPRLEQLYCTFGPNRALLNGRPLIHEHRALKNSLVAASFSNNHSDPERRMREYKLFGYLNDQTRGCLRLGSAATNICFTAAGRLQAAYGQHAKIWDIAGALAIASAAGCEIRITPTNVPFSLHYIVGSREVVSAIHELNIAHGLMEETCN